MAPFVPVDCGAVQDSLVEAELFGCRKGAFTGAEADRAGLFEEADGGTLFLDEITNTSTLFQAKLLRALQSGEFRRVGDTTTRSVDVRIIAATNADIEEAIRAGRFREDLYYRLNVVTVRMPSLRERREDIPPLAEELARAFCEKSKVAYRGIGEAALRRLCEHGWPGNVRELKNAVESALILSRDGAVRREFLPEPVRGGSFEEIRDLLRAGAASLGASGEDDGARETEAQAQAESNIEAPGPDPGREPAGPTGRPGDWLTEKEHQEAREADDRARICEALRRAEGDKSLAAVILGWSRMTLYRRMRRLGIDYATGKPSETQPV
jgi:two-component system response regulator HydG